MPHIVAHVTARSPFPLIDKILGGNLATELARLRGEGVSYDGIARWLLTEHGVHVSSETVRRWMREHVDPEAA